MARSPTPSVQSALRRAQIPLFLGAGAVALSLPIGVILLALGDSEAMDITAGVLLLVFCAAGILGVFASWLYLRQGVRVARSQTEFLGSVSHELRTPMTSMRMFVDALLDERLTDETQRQECLRTLRGELIRLDRLVARLIAVSRLESAPGQLLKQPVATDRILEEAMAAHRTLQLSDPANTGKVHVDATPGLTVLGDADSLVQAVANLLANARKHGGADLDINMTCHPMGTHWVDLGVIDQGPGLDTGESKEVFDKFHRGRNARDSGTQGSGLGLAIVEGIVKAHGGRIELRSGVGDGKGCAFHLILPRAVAPETP